VNGPQLGARQRTPAGVCRFGAGGGSGSWLEADLVAEGFEPGDQAAGFSLGVEAAGEEVSAEVVVGPACGQDVPDDEWDTRSHMLRVHLADGRASMTWCWWRCSGLVL
jgi:hypothetical protein